MVVATEQLLDVSSLKTAAQVIKHANRQTARKSIRQAKKGLSSQSNSPPSITYSKKRRIRRFFDAVIAAKSRSTILSEEVPMMNTSTGETSSFEPELARILSMERAGDWDGEGARPITKEACQAALLFRKLIEINLCRAPDSIAPSTRGAVGFTWRAKSDQMNIQIHSGLEDGCIVRRAGARGRSQDRCSLRVALQELRLFLALD